ncbi:MAG: ankyrin repeat domain-containing protein [Thermoguttaceae bacterium]
MKTVIMTMVVLAVCAPAAFGQTAVPLEEAVKDGKAEVAISGIGGSTGDAILIIARRRVPGVLRLTLTLGTVFGSVSGTVQNMVGAAIKGERVGENSYRPATEIFLADNDKHSYVVEAYCLDFHKANPGPRDSFTLAAPDPRAARILSAGQDKSASIGAIQSALWMARDGLSPTQVQSRFPATTQDLAMARSVIGQVAQGANQQVRRQAEAVTASATEPTTQPGDTVVVVTEGAKLMAGDTVIAALKAGTQMKVVKLAAKWIAVAATVNGANRIGWVSITDLRRVPTQGAAKADTLPAPAAAVSDTRIHDAAKTGDVAAIRALLEKQPTLISAANNDGQTPLHIAAKNGQREVAKLLLEKDAQVNARDKFAGTPLHWAAFYSHESVAELLLAKGAATDSGDRKGWTPLHYAAYNGCKGLADLLISRGADVHVKQAEGMTPLHVAALNGKKDLAELLIGKGARVDVKDNNGRTPVEYALARGHKDCAAFLRAENPFDTESAAGKSELPRAGDAAPTTVAALHQALKAANPHYTGEAKVYKDEHGKIWGIDMSKCRVTSLEPLRGMELKAVVCNDTEVQDLSPLKGMQLEQFICATSQVDDLSVLAGMPLHRIDISGTKVRNLKPLKGMSLQEIGFNPHEIAEGIEVLREMTSLLIIFTDTPKQTAVGPRLRAGLQPKTFWENYDRGEFRKTN